MDGKIHSNLTLSPQTPQRYLIEHQYVTSSIIYTLSRRTLHILIKRYLIERFALVHHKVRPEVEDVDGFVQFAVENIHGLCRHQHVARVIRERQLSKTRLD